MTGNRKCDFAGLALEQITWLQERDLRGLLGNRNELLALSLRQYWEQAYMDQFQSALHQALSSDNFNVWPHIIAMAAAYILALPIGWHREREERSAGLRTFPLVAVASCGFVKATEGVTVESPEALARIIEGVITGMGFIGGGAILRLSSSVKGTATAASLWATGAIGIACAVNAFDVAIIIMIFALITLALFSNGKDDIKKPSNLGFETKPDDPDIAR